MSENILMKDVTIGEKVFIRLENTIRQVKIVGFKTDSDIHNFYNSVVYLIDMGNNEILSLDIHNFNFDQDMYRTVKDAVNRDPIDFKSVSAEAFTEKYMKDECVAYGETCFYGYQWENNSAVRHYIPKTELQLMYVNGKTKFIGEAPDPKKWYQTAEKCIAHNTPKVIYYTD